MNLAFALIEKNDEQGAAWLFDYAALDPNHIEGADDLLRLVQDYAIPPVYARMALDRLLEVPNENIQFWTIDTILGNYMDVCEEAEINALEKQAQSKSKLVRDAAKDVLKRIKSQKKQD